MPRKPIDYKNCIIYHFVCNDASIVNNYIGHTTNFAERKMAHKSACNNENVKAYHYKVYQNIRVNGGWTNWEMMPLEEYPCENNIQARIREQYWIDKLRAELNAIKAFSTETPQDYYKQYYIDHRDEINQKNKQFYKEHRDEISQTHKQYYVDHRDKIIQKSRQFYEEHREIICKKITCKCGIAYTYANKSNHFKSKKHLLNLA